jgi:hypothetical protein
MYGERGGVYRVLVEKPEGKGPIGRHEVGRVGMDWIDVAEDRDRWRGLVNAVMNHWFS